LSALTDNWSAADCLFNLYWLVPVHMLLNIRYEIYNKCTNNKTTLTNYFLGKHNWSDYKWDGTLIKHEGRSSINFHWDGMLLNKLGFPMVVDNSGKELLVFDPKNLGMLIAKFSKPALEYYKQTRQSRVMNRWRIWFAHPLLPQRNFTRKF